jgi:hypothetical protein
MSPTGVLGGWGAAMGHRPKELPSSRAREYRWVDVVEDYVRFSSRPTAEELDLLHRGTNIVRGSSCTLSLGVRSPRETVRRLFVY